ncbi:uncharacterized protein PGRI_085630 [Penicillium griseofulvum]|uniref:Uncharacterized protein n=1 Tax=Penicillium patulum TaxID=5078 RepID=A0A135LTM6_PENPA|nr:uncharacterized protein PGRI_085630 [Penicillium griseofulvum]KXG52279.1 hypothetical protein PGRI_085630 [Penicillium griseofulvum]
MKDTVAWSSLLPTLPETEDELLATVRARVAVWLGDGNSCTAETITEASTQTGRISSGATTTTITEATTKTVSGCRNSPTLNGIADVGIAPVAASASAVMALLKNGPIKTVTDYTTKTITSSSVPASTTSSTPATTSTTSTAISDSTTTPGTTVPVTTTVTTRTTSSTAVTSSSTSTQISGSTTTISASVCSSLITNPTYTPSAALPYNYTWGCAPGYLCKPPHTGDRSGCNVEAGLPDPGYICNPSDCIAAPPLDVHPDWQYNVSNNYYNLNPVDFGLNYSIFQFTEDPVAANSKRDMSLWDFDAARKTKRDDITKIPNVCFNDCNVAAREPEMLGKTSELCESDSTFMENLSICEECITNNGESGSEAYSSKMLSTFAQWLNYCSDMVTSTDMFTSTTQASSTTTEMEITTTGTLVTVTTTTSTKATTVATITTTQTTSTKATRTKVTRTEENSTNSSSTEDTNIEPTNTEPNDTQSIEESSAITETEETSSPIERTSSAIIITTSASGSIVTTSVSGSLVTTSFSESVVTISTSGSLVTSSVPGSIMTTSVSGSLITTSLSGLIKTMSSTQDASSGDKNTSDNASGGTLSSVRGSQTGSASPSVLPPSYNAAGLIKIPHIGLVGLLWAAFATLL